MENRYFFKNGRHFAFSPLQIAEGLAYGLRELTEEEKQVHLNPHPAISPQFVKDEVTQKRWEVETGGITLSTGVRVATGIDDQNRITSVIANARLTGIEMVSFKAESGWVTLTLSELEGVAAAIAMHVQQCFSAERAHHEAVDALAEQHEGDAESLDIALKNYDLQSHWPAIE